MMKESKSVFCFKKLLAEICKKKRTMHHSNFSQEQRILFNLGFGESHRWKISGKRIK